MFKKNTGNVGGRNHWLFLCLLLWSCMTLRGAGVSRTDILTVLDNPEGVEVVEFQYRTPKRDAYGNVVYDEKGQIVYLTTVSPYYSDYFTVQKNQEYYTVPQSGGSCLRSQYVAANYSARIVLKVHGPGLFKVKYKTSSGFGDYFGVFVDGEVRMKDSGYQYGYTPGTLDWKEIEVGVSNGRAPEGSRYAGTYDHEIILEYEKDGTTVEEDGPVPPVEPQEWWYGDDHEAYLEDYRRYLIDYNNYLYVLSYYNDCIWLDAGFIPLEYDPATGKLIRSATVWYNYPLNLIMNNGQDAVFVDPNVKQVVFDSTAWAYGYTVRYTTDGTLPTASSPELDVFETVTVDHSCRVTAAIFDGESLRKPEIIASQKFTKKAAVPSIEGPLKGSTPDGLLYSMKTASESCDIYYRLNDGEEQRYDGPVTITAAGKLSAATRGSSHDMLDSDETNLYVWQSEAPVISATCGRQSIVSGQVLEAGNVATAKIRGNERVSLQYRMGRKDDWKPCVKNQSLVCENTVTIQARAVEDGLLASPIVSWQINIADRAVIIGGTDDADVQLTTGWNLLAVPWALTESSERTLLRRLNLFTAVKQTFVRAEKVEAGQAYFVYVPDGRTCPEVFVEGAEPEWMPQQTKAAGWRLVCPLKGDDEAVSGWQWTGKAFEYVEDMQSDRGAFSFFEETVR